MYEIRARNVGAVHARPGKLHWRAGEPARTSDLAPSTPGVFEFSHLTKRGLLDNITAVPKTLLAGLATLIYPPRCPYCHKSIPDYPTGKLCPRCLLLIEFNRPPFCVKCSRHMGERANSLYCKECVKFNPAFDFAWGACLYNDILKTLLFAFKYHQKTYLRNQLATFMIRFIEEYQLDIRQFDVIVPVPLAGVKERERGYNQAELLAQNVAKHFNMNIFTNKILRIRNTQSQTLLSQKERWTNTQGAFRINHSSTFKSKSVLIIDDLLTTGATAAAVAGVLKEHKAKTVGVLTLGIAHTNENY